MNDVTAKGDLKGVIEQGTTIDEFDLVPSMGTKPETALDPSEGPTHQYRYRRRCSRFDVKGNGADGGRRWGMLPNLALVDISTDLI